MSSLSAPTLADAATLVVALDRDAQRSAAEQRAEDSRLAAQLPASAGRAEFALAWLEATCVEDAELRTHREQAATIFSTIGLAMATGGALLGAIAAVGALSFDGAGRVNLVALLALIVLLPGLFLIPFAWAALPTHWTRRLPGATALHRLAQALGPGRLAALGLRRLPPAWRVFWERGSGRASAHQTRYASLQRWAILRWSQLFALGFQLAAFVATTALVIFTDLAFGWSTTLTSGNATLDASRVHAITTALVSPWAWATEAAAPSLQLVEASRFQRVAPVSLSPAEAAQLGNWWPFLLAILGFYGVLPRIVTLLLANSRLRYHLRATAAATPGLTPLLARLHRAAVQTRAPTEEKWDNAAPPPKTSPLPSSDSPLLETHYPLVLNWAEVPIDPARLTACLGARVVENVGGSQSLDADQALLARLPTALDDPEQPLACIVKGWEPPVLDFLDFVRDLRRVLGQGRELVVFPLGLDADNAPAPASPTHLKIWRERLETLGDPWLRVAPLPPAPTA